MKKETIENIISIWFLISWASLILLFCAGLFAMADYIEFDTLNKTLPFIGTSCILSGISKVIIDGEND